MMKLIKPLNVYLFYKTTTIGFCVFYFILGVSTSLFCQEEEMRIVWSESEKTTDIEFSQVIGGDKKHLIVLKEKGEGQAYYISQYDDQMHLIQSKQLDMRIEGKQRKIESIKSYYGQIELYSSLYDSEKSLLKIYLEKISAVSLNNTSPAELVAQIPNYVKEETKLRFQQSRNLKNTLLMIDFERKEKLKKFELILITDSGKVGWQLADTFSFGKQKFKFEDFIVLNNGTACLSGVKYNDTDLDTDAKEKKQAFEVWLFTDSGRVKNKYLLTLPNKTVKSLKMAEGVNHDILLGGYYSTEKLDEINGVYVTHLALKSLKIDSLRTTEFSTAFLKQNLSEKEQEECEKTIAKDKSYGLKDYTLDEIIVTPQGGTILVGEQVYQTSRTYSTVDYLGTPLFYTTEYFHFNNVIITHLSPNGQVVWDATIQKKQFATNPSLLSYRMAVYDKLYFIYNDNPENYFLKNESDQEIISHKDPMALIVSVGLDGTVKKETLFKSTEVNTLMFPVYSKQIWPTEIFIFGENKNWQRFGRLTLDN